LHGIRPSEFIKYKKNIEDSFLKHKSLIQATLTDIVAKLSTWNTYFGLKFDGEEVYDEYPVEGDGNGTNTDSTNNEAVVEEKGADVDDKSTGDTSKGSSSKSSKKKGGGTTKSKSGGKKSKK
jgi:hypothetical protein